MRTLPSTRRCYSITTMISLAVVLSACGGDERGADGDTGGIVGPRGTDSGTMQDSSGGGPKLDVGDGTQGVATSAGDDGAQSGCAKVDFLFVIDNSGSMEDEQQNLVDSFPGFISTIRDTLMAQDYHLMVVDTDGGDVFGDPGICEAICSFAPACNGIPCDDLECGGLLGAGKITGKDGNACGIEGGRRYIVDSQPNLNETFACIAEVGITGSADELQAEAILAATSPELNEANACNDGFLRDDALLVVTVITDEEDKDDPFGGTVSQPSEWVQHLVDLKGGDSSSVVVLGLIGDTDQPDALCEPLDEFSVEGAEASPRLREFVESFPNHVLGSVCSPDYASFFESAVSAIDTACDDFVPVG